MLLFFLALCASQQVFPEGEFLIKRRCDNKCIDANFNNSYYGDGIATLHPCNCSVDNQIFHIDNNGYLVSRGGYYAHWLFSFRQNSSGAVKPRLEDGLLGYNLMWSNRDNCICMGSNNRRDIFTLSRCLCNDSARLWELLYI